MVTIIGYALRQNKDGKDFVSLKLQGSVELVQSLKTGRFYATARTCSLSSTFDEESAKRAVGSRFPGGIVRVQTDVYDYTIPETGEVITLAHSYQYSPEESALAAEPLPSLPILAEEVVE